MASVRLAGPPCGQHGNYSFYKALHYRLPGHRPHILAIGEFFFLQVWPDDDIVSIGEPQLFWEDRSSGSLLVSLRLYFRPENTPDGRTEDHGEHEVVALSEKVVMKAHDLVGLIRSADDVKWQTGLRGVYGPDPYVVTGVKHRKNGSPSENHKSPPSTPSPSLNNNNSSEEGGAAVKQEVVSLSPADIKVENGTQPHLNDVTTEPDHIKQEGKSSPPGDANDTNSCGRGTECPETLYYPPPIGGAVDMKEIRREKQAIGDVITPSTTHPIILTYDRYCRVRCALARVGHLEERMRSAVVQALGGFLVPSRNTLLLFCRDVFDYPELEGHDLLCNHLAPKLQGRPRKRPVGKRPSSLSALHGGGGANNTETESSEETEEPKPHPPLAPKLRGLAVPTKPNSLRALDRKAKPPSIGPCILNQRASGPPTKGPLTPRTTAYQLLHTTATPTTATTTTSRHLSTNGNNATSGPPPSYSNSLQPSHQHPHHQQPPPQPSQQDFSTPALNRLIEVDFMSKLHKFMRDRSTPIRSLPHIGYKQLNVFEVFSKVQQLGGYEAVTAKKQWKYIYDQLGGGPHPPPPNSANATANVLRRHYEKILLPYEKFLLNEQKRLYGSETAKVIHQHQLQHQHQHQLPARPTNHKKPSDGEPSVSILQVPKMSVGSSAKKDAQIPADLAKRPEITITPIPRSFNETFAAAAAAAASSPLGVLGSGFPPNLNLKSLGIDVPDLNMMDLNTLSNLSELAKKYDKQSSLSTMAATMVAAAAAAAAAAGGTGAPSTCEPSAKRFKPDDGGRLNGAREVGRQVGPSRGGPSGGLDLQAAATELSKLQSVPDLVSADLLRSMNLLDANSKLLLPAHQSTKTINALAALLPQTSIFPASAPAAHQQSARSPLKTSQGDSPRPEPPRVFQSQSVYSQSSRIYDKPTADHVRGGGSAVSPKDPPREPCTKESSPEIQILDLSRPPSSLGSSSSSAGGKPNKTTKSERLDVELLDLSTRRDITVSAVPKPSTGTKHSRSMSSLSQVSIKPPSDGVTITPNHSSSNSSNSNSINRNFRGNPHSNSVPNNADISSLMSSMPGAALMAAAAAAAQGMPQGLPQGLPHGLPPGLAGLGLGAPGSLPPGSIPNSLLPFLMNVGGSGANTSGSSSSPKMSSPSVSSAPLPSFRSSPAGGSTSTNNSSGPPGLPPMFPYVDSSLAAYYSSLLPPSLMQPSTPTSVSTSMAAAVQMAHLNSLGLPGGLLGTPPPPMSGPAPGVSSEALANLGMYKNFLGNAAAAAGNSSSGGGAIPPAHFLAALMSPGAQQKK